MISTDEPSFYLHLTIGEWFPPKQESKLGRHGWDSGNRAPTQEKGKTSAEANVRMTVCSQPREWVGQIRGERDLQAESLQEQVMRKSTEKRVLENVGRMSNRLKNI